MVVEVNERFLQKSTSDVLIERYLFQANIGKKLTSFLLIQIQLVQILTTYSAWLD